MVTGIIVGAGKSSRMGGTLDKLLLEVAGVPVLVHSWRRFDSCEVIDHVVIVTRRELVETVYEFARVYGMEKSFTVVVGGESRQESVWNGLRAVPAQTKIVAIHDAARPCISRTTIKATVELAKEKGAAITARPVTDTVKETYDGKVVVRTLDRSSLWAAQTPQTFEYSLIVKAHNEARARGIVVTDDAMACEMIGAKVWLVPADTPNPKLTLPEDIPLVEALLTKLYEEGRV